MDDFGYFYFKDRTGDTFRYVSIFNTTLSINHSVTINIVKNIFEIIILY